ncbi:MAG TPA: hypothetical protein VK854_11840 [Woeseiaceae bacterium]|nr:hypothetical protein [Woeseiaceae bacterium]
MNEKRVQEEQELLQLLKDYPAPEADAGFYDRALVRAVHKSSRRQRNRWMLAGFGSAIAAGLAIWMITAMLMTTPQLPDAEPVIPGVTIAMEQERTVRLVFASAEALDSATLTVSLPEGIELAGFPGQREITWETSLQEGKNLLPLTLVALTPAGGELLARLEHKDRNRTFRLRIDVS